MHVKKQELLLIPEHLTSSTVYFVVAVLLIVLVL
jgi:hypothetical protein